MMAGETLDEAQRQVSERANVEIDHCELLRAVEACRRAAQAEAGVVDEDGRIETARGERAGKLVRPARLGKIDRQQLRGSPAGGGNPFRHSLEPIEAPRHQHGCVPVCGKYAGERLADTGRRAGDHGHGLQS